MTPHPGDVVREPDGRWAAMCWACWQPDLAEGRSGWPTKTAALSALRGHRKTEHPLDSTPPGPPVAGEQTELELEIR